MWDGYSAREAAEVVGLPESAVRSCVRAGFLDTDSGAVDARLSFRDLRVLEAIKRLLGAGISLRRARRQIAAMLARMPADASLAEVSLAAHAGHVVVRDRDRAWRADTGQLVFAFLDAAPAGELHAMPVRHEAPGPEPTVGLSADEWFDRAVAYEDVDTARAIEAYNQSLRLQPECSETWINLGRLHAESGHSARAAECFGEALRIDPGDATALYNLGVVAQDAGRDGEAIDYYRRALELDPGLAEAHYNLATLFDRGGDARSAIRHINEYRKLTKYTVS